LRILDALVKALEARELPVTVTDSDKQRTQAAVLGEQIGFYLCEETRRQEREPTPAEKNEDAKWERFRHLRRITQRFEWVPTGKLILQITDGSGLQRCWTDRSDRRVEQFLNSFIVGLFRAAERLKEERAELERRRREQEAAERRRQEQEQRRREEEQKRREEEARFRRLEEDALAWAKAQQLRAYLAAFRQNLGEMATLELGGELDEWLKWAEARVNALDPLMRYRSQTEMGG